MTRRRTTVVELSMFPFLSVLCVVIGILMLFMIVIISTRVIRAEAAESILPGPWSDSDLGVDEGEREGPRAAEDRHKALADEIYRLTDRLIREQDECSRLRQSHAELETLIETKWDELDRLAGPDSGGPRSGRALALPEKVKVVPDTRRKVLKTPILVEVQAEGYVVHHGGADRGGREKTEYAVQQLHESTSPLRRFIERVDRVREKEYLLLLLHPNGVTSYKRLRVYLREHYGRPLRVGGYVVARSRIDVGVEPFSPDWLLITESRGAEH